jgi:hypothetical protein
VGCVGSGCDQRALALCGAGSCKGKPAERAACAAGVRSCVCGDGARQLAGGRRRRLRR